jgi:outer membrane lipopolysaccharide assembly protein LptE/RlpB
LKRVSFLIFFVLILPSSCGYHLRGKETNLPPDIRSVAIPIFANRTIQTGIESVVTQALLEKFSSAKVLAVAPQSSADSLLNGTVLSFTTFPVAVTAATQFSTENRATVTLEFTFRDQRSGKVMFRESMSDWRNYPVVFDLNATEQFKKEAIRQISALLAERIYELILGSF